MHLKLLGAIQVSRDGKEVDLPASRKSRALLGYLALTGVACRRDALCALFWDVPDDPRGALRWSLSKLRPVVNCSDVTPLVADRVSVRLDTENVEVDLDFVRAVAVDDGADPATRARAWHMAKDELLMDCDLPSQEGFSDWLSSERAAIRAMRAEIAQKLAEDVTLPVQERDEWAARWQRDTETPNTTETVSSCPQQRQEVRFIRAHDGVNLAWAEVGDPRGPTLIKAANWLTHLELDWEAPIWSPLFHDLAQDHHVVRYDERGCGLSDWDVPEISFETFVADLEQVVEAAGVDQFALLGISQGAAVSIEYAVRHPERVSKLILFGGYPVGWRPIATPQEAKEREAVMVLTGSGWGRTDPTYRRLFSQTFMPDGTLEELDWFDDFQRRTTSPDNAVRFLEAFSTIDVRDRLRQVRVPTLVLHSRGDRRIPHATGRDLAAQIPGARLVTLESEGHLLIGREPAAQDFVTAVRDFLRDE